MRRFRTAALVLLVALLLLRALAWTSAELAPEPKAVDFADYRSQVRHLLAESDAITAVTLGNSHNEAIDFDALGMRGFHLWRPGGDLEEASYLASTLLPRLPKLRRVFLAVSYGMFRVENGDSNDRAVVRREMYAAVPSSRMLSGDLKSWVVGKLHPYLQLDLVARSDHWEGVAGALLPGDRRPRLQHAPRDEYGQYVRPAYLRCVAPPTAALGALATERVRKVLGTNGAADRHTGARAVAALRDVLRTMAARGVQVVLYTPPYTQAYTRAFPPAVRDETTATARRLARQFGAQYLDLSMDPRFTTRTELFTNTDHLNRCGAEEFSVALRTSLGG
jgi:hypothetical protein